MTHLMKKLIFLITAISFLLIFNPAYSQTHPSDAIVCAGSNAVFSISYPSAATFQWQAYSGGLWANIPNGGNVSGATTTTLTITGCAVNMDRTAVRCRITSASGTIYTNQARLYVLGIINQPVNRSICSGTSAVFSVTATTTYKVPSYAWQYSTNGVNWYTISTGGSGSPGYSGYNTASLTVTNPPSTYYFRCRVTYTSPSCTEYSNVAIFYNNSLPEINSQPVNRNVCYGGSTTFSVTVNEPGVTYQWQRVYYQEGIHPIPGMWVALDLDNGGGSPGYSGVTTPTLTVSNITFDWTDQSGYRCVVTNCNGERQSTGASYTVVYPPSITLHPASKKICAGSGTTFGVNVNGYNLNFRWQVSTNGGTSWSNITSAGSSPTYSGYTSATLGVSSTVSGNSGYRYRCYVSGGCSPAVYSNAATLTVDPSSPSITTQPTDVANCAGETAFFTVGAPGVGQSYTWYVSTNGGSTFNPITTAGSNPTYGNFTSASLRLSGTTAANDNYRYYTVLTNSCGSVTSATRTLHVSSPLVVTSHPEDVAVCDGIDASFNYMATGSITGQKWQISMNNGSSWEDISASMPVSPTHSGYHSPSLQISAPAFTDNGYQYRSIITGSTVCTPQSITSAPVTLTVTELTSIDTQPESRNICTGDNTSFTVAARGTNLVYQWQLSVNNGSSWTDISETGVNPGYTGWNTNTLNLENVIPENNMNQYRVRIASSCSNPQNSAIAVLRVLSPPGTANPITGKSDVCIGETGVEYALSAITGAETYLWTLPEGASGSSTTNSIEIDFPEGTVTGNLTVTGINACGTSNVSSRMINIKSNSSAPEVIFPSSELVCPGNNVSLEVTGGSLGTGATWKWYSGSCGGAPLGTGQILNVSSLTQTTSFFVRAEGDCNTTLCAETVINVHPSTRITQQPESMTACYGAEAQITVIAEGPAPLQYQWLKGTTPITEKTGNNILVLENLTFADQGQYRCIVTSLCDASGIQSESVSLTIQPQPTVNLGETKHFCPGSFITLNAGAGFSSYLWSTGADTRTIDVNEQGMYEVVVTDANGCSNSSQVFVIADYELPPVDLGPDLTVCKNTPVVLDAMDEFDFFLWNNNSTARELHVFSTGKYWVKAGRFNTVCTTSDTIHVTVAEPYSGQELCIVTVSNAGKNMLVWEKTTDPAIVGYKIYKGSAAAGTYDSIGFVNHSEMSAFVDQNSSPSTRSDKYRISVVDTCGNESVYSPYHKTIHLAVSPAMPAGFNLSWDHIEVEGLNKSESFPTYYIYRGTNYASLEHIDQLSSENNQYTDSNPPEGEVFYQISAKKLGVCMPTASKKGLMEEEFEHSFSNIEDVISSNSGIRRVQNNLLIYPNPFSESTLIKFSNPENSTYVFRVTDLSGKVVKEKGIITGETYEMTRDGLETGMYIIELKGNYNYRTPVIVF